MSKSDILTSMAVKAENPIAINNRKVTVDGGGIIKVLLHGKLCVTLDKEKGIIDIDGATVPSRKSVRLINSILACFGRFKVSTQKGQWILNTPQGKKMPFSDKIATVPIID